MSDPNLGQLLVYAIPFITRMLTPATSEALSRFVEETGAALAAHYVADLGNEKWLGLRKRLLEYAEKETKPPLNHDLQKAFYKSFLMATEVIYAARLEELGVQRTAVSWASVLRRHVMKKLQASQITTLSLARDEKETLLELCERVRTEIKDCDDISREDLERHLPIQPDVSVLTQLTVEAKARGDAGDALVEILMKQSPWYLGLTEPLLTIARNMLFDCISAFFSEEIKNNERVRAVLDAEILAGTGVKVDTLVAELHNATQWLAALSTEVKAVKDLIAREFQKVFRLIDAEFLEHRKRESLTSFLGIAAGDWKLVAQGQSLPRDLAAEVFEKVLDDREKAVLQVIRGEPGSGKSTLLLQIGAKLVSAGCIVLEMLPAASVAEFLYYARTLTHAAQSRLFVLIDDIYKNEDRAILVDVLSNPGETLPITIIASTSSFEDRTNKILINSFLDVLSPVSPDFLTDRELAELKQMPTVTDLTAQEFKSLTKSRKILVVMLQLSQGKPLDQILLSTAERLKKKYRTTYKAWETVVTFGRWNLPVPGSLLNRSLKEPYFSDSLRINPAKVGSEGIIFTSSYPFQEGWSAGHPIIARAAFDVEFKDTLGSTCEAILQSIDWDDHEHARFLGRMLRFLSSTSASRDERWLARDILKSHEQKLSELAFQSPEGQHDWASAFINLGRKDLARDCLKSAKPSTPASALFVSNTLEEFGLFENAIHVAQEWCDLHQEDTHVRTFYLGLVERRGKLDRIEQAIAITSVWLAEHDTDTSVRTFYFGLVERKGKPDQIEKAITTTSEWLAGHDKDTSSVRTSYLGLVERKGKPGQVEKTIATTSEWLAEHDDNTAVRAFYLGLVERRGKPDQIEKAITTTSGWLTRHNDTSSVRTSYLGLVERKGKPDQVEKAIATTSEWLAGHETDTYVRTFYLGLVERRGKPDQIENAIATTSVWLAEHDENTDVRTFYLGLVERRGKPDQIEKAIATTSVWLAVHDEGTDVRVFYLGLVEREGPAKEILKVVGETRKWLAKHTDAQSVWAALIGLLTRRGELSLVADVVAEAVAFHPNNQNVLEHQLDMLASQQDDASMAKIFADLQLHFPNNNVVFLRYASWLSEKGQMDAAEKEYRRLFARGDWPHLRQSYGRHLLRVGEWKAAADQFQAARRTQLFRAAALEGEGLAVHGMAKAALAAGDRAHAIGYFQEAERLFKSAIRAAQRQHESVARFHTSLGWFYLDRHRFAPALKSFNSALAESPFLTSYWGKGVALMSLGRHGEALSALETAIAQAHGPLNPPAADEIPRLIAECEAVLSNPKIR
jgi:tetratricopeptide (TPR) repeat protein